MPIEHRLGCAQDRTDRGARHILRGLNRSPARMRRPGIRRVSDHGIDDRSRSAAGIRAGQAMPL
jgi:hypothetical protein